MTLEPLQSDKQKATWTGTIHSPLKWQKFQEDKWHWFHSNIAGLDKKEEYQWKLEGMFREGEYILRPWCVAEVPSMSYS